MGSTASNSASATPMPDRVTGVQLMQGIGVRPAVGYWTDVWHQVLQRRPALFALAWISVVAFFAVFAPVLASGHPLWLSVKSADGSAVASSPLWRNLTSIDLLLLAWALGGALVVALARSGRRGSRFIMMIGALIIGIAVIAISGVIDARLTADATEQIRDAATKAARTGLPIERASPFRQEPGAGYIVGGLVAAAVFAAVVLVPIGLRRNRITVGLAACVVAALCVGARWERPLERYTYIQQELTASASASYTLIPWSPSQRYSALDRRPPGTQFGPAMKHDPATAPFGRRYLLGTDAFGSDVLSQLLHACRLSISIGLVSTSIALVIGVTLGALMGYFGGWVDLLLYRVVEIFQAVPVLFLLIVSAAVLPPELRTTYVMMAIIGCFTWTGMARFTRAEFLKLRNQDFVQSAVATGLPLSSVLFKHMLPNGVAPVLVDTSFAVAAAISVEATLSYLGLGPVDSASWGRLLSSAVSSEGGFKWWLAVFPGGAIFLTVLSYNLLGEALRDAIDPRLKKARV
jgi:ABC-type dipeptide/oligopeptide/nickel transport system permease subunit